MEQTTSETTQTTSTNSTAGPAVNPTAAQTQQKETVKQVRYHDYRGHSWHTGRIFFGVCIILLGLLFLARNFGLVDVSVGMVMAKLWPLLIILFGLSMLARNTAIGAVVTVIAIVIIFAAVVYAIGISGNATGPIRCMSTHNGMFRQSQFCWHQLNY